MRSGRGRFEMVGAVRRTVGENMVAMQKQEQGSTEVKKEGGKRNGGLR